MEPRGIDISRWRVGVVDVRDGAPASGGHVVVVGLSLGSRRRRDGAPHSYLGLDSSVYDCFRLGLGARIHLIGNGEVGHVSVFSSAAALPSAARANAMRSLHLWRHRYYSV